jgi:protoporphyrinogen oxidase
VKSPENAPEGCSSLQFEIYSRGEQSQYSKEEVVANTLAALVKMGIGQPEDVLFTDHRVLNFGNVIFDLGMEANRQRVLDWAAANGIASCGRFGAWDYLWSNQSLLSGYNAF